MNKSELVERVADRAGLGRGDAAGAVEAALEAIERELAAGGEVSITGFGKFSVTERAPRQARNPQTGADARGARQPDPWTLRMLPVCGGSSLRRARLSLSTLGGLE